MARAPSASTQAAVAEVARDLSLTAFVQRVAIIFAMLIGALVVWKLSKVLLLGFAAVLVSLSLHAIADPLRKWGLGRLWALLAAILIIAAVTAAMVWIFGSEAQVQIHALSHLIPKAWADLQARLAGTWLGDMLEHEINGAGAPSEVVLAIGSRLFRETASGLATMIIVISTGLYLAFDPHTYVAGSVKLLPPKVRPRGEALMQESGDSLKRWLIGQTLSMAVSALITGLGLWLAGVPAPLALGLLAGVAHFIPVIGPMVAALPGLLLAAVLGPEKLALTAFVYVAATQLHANLFGPLLMRSMVEMPMALTLFAVLALGLLLGPLGIVFATPLAVLANVAIRQLYLKDILGEDIDAAPTNEDGPARKLIKRTLKPSA